MEAERSENSSRKQHTMNYRQKYSIIRQMEQGKSLAEVAREYEISKSTVHYIFKDRERIKTIYEDSPVS